MKKTNRALALAVLAVLLVTSLVSLVACSGAKDALEGYQLSVTSVKDDFVLPRIIGDNTKVKWKSDNSAIEIVKRRGEDYLAKVTLGDTIQKVTLTVSASGAGSKDFTVNVQALNAMLFANEYVFPQEGLEVSKDFDLEQSWENRGKTATITWTVDDQYKQYISVENNSKCVVDVPAETTRVELKGTFKYNGSEATKPFTFYVAQPKSPREEINHWYNNSSYTINTSGYVTGIATPYDSNYSNATFYMIADDMQSAYYLYRSKSNSAADGEALKVGAHVTVTGVLSSDYNGLMEAAAGSIFTVDTDIAAKDPAELVYNLDNDVTSGAPALKWHTGALVKVSNWTISKISDASTSKAGTLLTLTKDNATITVGYNNYMEGFYTSADNKPSTELTAIKTKAGTFKVGDSISVTGILSYYSPDFQILPRSDKDIVAGTADTTATAGSKVKAAITAVTDALKTAGIIDSDGAAKFITSKLENKELPTKVGDVTIKYEETFDGSATEIKDGKITVTPQAKLQNTTVEVTYTVDGYTTWTYFKVRSQDLDDAGKVAYVKENLGNEITTKYEKAGEQNLPQASDFGWDGLTITWSIKESVSYASISANKKLTVSLPKDASKFTLVAAIKMGSAEDTYEVEISVAAAPNTVTEFSALTAAKEGTYKLHMYQANLKLDLYATGAMDGYYYGTTEDASVAADFVVTAVEGGYTIKVGDKFAEIVPRTDGSTGINVVFNATQTAGKVWKWNDTIKTFTMMSGNNDKEAADVEYFLGTSGTYKTFSANKVADASSKYVGQWGELKVWTIGQIVANEEAKVGDYYLGLYQAKLNKWLYATGKIVTNTSGNFGETTEDPSEAALFTIAGTAEAGYTIKVGDKYLELDEGHKYALVDASTKTWKWNTEAKVFTFDVGEVTYYLGTYNSFNTISASEITRITGEKASDVGVSQFPAYFGTIYGYDRNSDHEHKWEYTWVDGTMTHTKRCTVEGCTYGTAETEECTVEENVCELCKHTYEAVNYGSENEPISVEAALALAAMQCTKSGDFTKELVYVTGKIKGVTTKGSGAFITTFYLLDLEDPSKEIMVYSMNLMSDGVIPDQNDIIVLKGYITLYGTTIEFSTYNKTVYVQMLNLTRGDSTITIGTCVGGTVNGIESGATAKNGNEVSFTVAKNGEKDIVVKVNGEAITAEEGTYKFTMHGNATITVEEVNEGALEAKIQYTTNSTTNMSGNNDAKSVFGLDDSIFTITSEKTNNGGNHVGLNKDGTLRLYKNHTATMHIEVATGYVIDNIEVTLATTSPVGLAGLVVEVGSSTVDGANGVYAVNAQKVSIWNSNTDSSNNQIYVKTIVITYHAEA